MDTTLERTLVCKAQAAPSTTWHWRIGAAFVLISLICTVFAVNAGVSNKQMSADSSSVRQSAILSGLGANPNLVNPQGSSCSVDADGARVIIAGVGLSGECSLPQETEFKDTYRPQTSESVQMGLFETAQILFYDEDYAKLADGYELTLLAHGDSAAPIGNLSAHEAAIYLEHGVLDSNVPTLIFKSEPYKSPYDGEDGFFRSDIRSMPLEGPDAGKVNVLYSSTNTVNGGTMGHDGRLYFCFKGAKLGNHIKQPGIYSVDPNNFADWRAVVTSWGGKMFNSPNDVVMKLDGTLWFTDPPYGWAQGSGGKPQVGNWVWRFDPKTGSLAPVADGFERPNGIVFSPDEKTMYIGDSGWLTGHPGDELFEPSGPRSVYAFDVLEGRVLSNRRLIYTADKFVPDAIKVDAGGRLYIACGDGVHVTSATGELLAKILVNTPKPTANMCFGRGAHENTLYIMSKNMLVSAKLGSVRGQPVGPN